MYRWDVINSFIEKRNYKTYLEIGYYKGWSFDSVSKVLLKTAVDPNPSKTPEQEQMKEGEYAPASYEIGSSLTILYKMRSDDFFNMISETTKFDIVFIDGLHESFQVYRDIMNSLDHLSPGGTIIMHDCKPELYEHTTTGDCGGNWLGDTYKAFLKFKFERPEYTSYVVDTDWGCGVIETPPDLQNTYIDGLFKGEDYRNFLAWDKFSENKADLLSLISIEQFKTKLNEEIKDNNLSA